MEPGDEQLMARVVRRDADALEILYNRYAPAVMGLIMRIVDDRREAEELLQETFWRVWSQSRSFDPQRGSFRGWLFAVGRNLALDRRRRQSIRPHAARSDREVLQMEQSHDDVSVPEVAWSAIRHKQVRSAMNELPAEQYEVIDLAYFHGLTRREIARVTAAPLGTIHTRARLALQKLRQLLAEPREEEA